MVLMQYDISMNEIEQIEQWFKMNKAKNFKEWEDAVKLRYLPSKLCMQIMKEIFLFIQCRFPQKKSSYDWKDYIPVIYLKHYGHQRRL